MSFSQYRDRFQVLARQFRGTNSPQLAIQLAGDLCSALADLAGDLVTAETRFRSELANQHQPPVQQPLQYPEPDPVFRPAMVEEIKPIIDRGLHCRVHLNPLRIDWREGDVIALFRRDGSDIAVVYWLDDESGDTPELVNVDRLSIQVS